MNSLDKEGVVVVNGRNAVEDALFLHDSLAISYSMSSVGSSYRQIGQVLWIPSHCLMQSSWKRCLHGNTLHFSDSVNFSLQTVHSTWTPIWFFSIIITENHIGVHVECTVCKENFSESEKCKVLPCKHLFHGDCIKQWLGIHNTCPICRYEFLTDDKEYELAKQSPKIAFSYFPSLMLPTRTTPSFLTFPTARSLFLSTTPSFLTFPTHQYIRSTIASLTTPILTTTPIPSAPPTPTARLTQAAIFPRTSNLGTEQKMRYNIPNRNKITPRNNDKRNKQIKTNHNNKRYYQPNSNKNTGNKNKNRSNANRKPNRKT